MTARHPGSAVDVSVVVPVFNSVETVIELVERLERVFAGKLGLDHEVILVDDGSPRQETWPALERLAHERPQVRAVRLMRNFGKPGAVLCGFEEARGRRIVTLDDDLQQPPEEIPRLLQASDHDVVIGRYKSRQDTWFAGFASRIKGWFDARLLGKPRGLQVTPFKLFKAEVAKAMLEIRTPYPFIPALMFYLTKDVVNVEVEHAPRTVGRSGYTLDKKVRQFLRLLINNSALPLQLVATLGVLMAVLSLVLGAVFVVRKLAYGVGVSGWTSLMVVLLLTSGMILLSLGIIGEYLIRISNGIDRRPPYVVRQRAAGAAPTVPQEGTP